MNVNNLSAGFWRRFAVRGFDLVIVCLILIGFAIWFIDIDKLEFKNSWMFYFWCILFIFLLILTWIIIPYYFSGHTLGSYIFKSKLVFNSKKRLQAILKREIFFSIAWSIQVLLIMIVINHTLAIKYFKIDEELTGIDVFKKAIVSSIGSIIAIGQLGTGISIIISKNGNAVNDKYSLSKLIIKNKYEKKEKPKINYDPRKLEKQKEKIEWIKE